MAGRLDTTHSTGGSAATAMIVAITLAALFGVTATPVARAAQQTWGDESSASVLVESGAAVGGPDSVPSSDGDGTGIVVGDGPADAIGQSFGDASGCCPNCTGAGCDSCCSAALVDVRCHEKKACWIGRVDALILWRNAPPDRPLLDNDLVVGPLLDANGMDSPGAAGPRFSIFRVNNCTGHAVEATYLRAANFRSQQPLSQVDVPYVLSAPGIYGNRDLTFDSGNANLGARLQSFELNRHLGLGPNVRFLAGFRWIEWQEQFTLDGATTGGISDFYQTNCFNDLYGGQIGLDGNLLATPWIRFDGLIKAGAYYNNAVQSSEYVTNDPLNPGTASIAVDGSPLSGAFAGEVGLTGVVPITNCLDFRFGYFGLWLSGIAQPTQQLTGQTLTPGQPAVGTINANGGVVLQGVSLGLEGRW